MSSCALHLHTCSSHASEPFPRCPFCIPALRSPPVAISTFLSCMGIKHFWIGPRLAKRPWFTTGRPPVKFRIIWTSFDTPTVNRGTEKASCVLQPNTPPIWPKTHLSLLHHLDRSITIAWLKTTPHLDSPSSLYAYLKTPPNPDLLLPPETLKFYPRRPDTSAPTGRISTANRRLPRHRRRPRAPPRPGSPDPAPAAQIHPAAAASFFPERRPRPEQRRRALSAAPPPGGRTTSSPAHLPVPQH